MNYLPRHLERKFLKMSDTFKAVMVTGARQVGKSTMLEHLAKGQGRTFVTMDRLRDRELARTDPDLFFQTYRPPILIDEIQKAPELFEPIKVLCDSTDERGLFWLTGSQSKKLMREAGDSLAGRVCILKMYSLSVAEQLGIPEEGDLGFAIADLVNRAQRYPDNNVNDVFERIWRGGMPEAQGLDSEQLHAFFDSYIQTYLMRDAVEDNGVENTEGFLKFLRASAAYSGRLLNYTELATASGVSVPTAKAWTRVLQSMGIVYLLEPYANNELKRLVKTPKLYFCDTGLCAFLSMWTSKDALQQGAVSGHYYENHVIMELVRHYAYAPSRATLSYYRDTHQREIDLIVEENGALHPFEVKKAASPAAGSLKRFSLLDVPNVNRGEGGIICMCTDPFPLDASDALVPGNIF